MLEIAEGVLNGPRLVAEFTLGLQDDKTGAGRSCSRLRKTGRIGGTDEIIVQIKFSGDGPREVVHRHELAARKVKRPCFVEPDDPLDTIGQVGCVRRRAPLVGDNVDPPSIAQLVDYPERDVGARGPFRRAVHENRPGNGPLIEAGYPSGVLTGLLASAVIVERTWTGLLIVWPIFAVEHEVGRHLYEPRADRFTGSGDILNRVGIDLPAEIPLLLALIHLQHRCTNDHNVKRDIIEEPIHLLGIGDVERYVPTGSSAITRHTTAPGCQHIIT